MFSIFLCQNFVWFQCEPLLTQYQSPNSLGRPTEKTFYFSTVKLFIKQLNHFFVSVRSNKTIYLSMWKFINHFFVTVRSDGQFNFSKSKLVFSFSACQWTGWLSIRSQVPWGGRQDQRQEDFLHRLQVGLKYTHLCEILTLSSFQLFWGEKPEDAGFRQIQVEITDDKGTQR